MRIKILKSLVFATAIFLTGCSIKEPVKPQAVNFTIISPMIKINDAGFIKTTKNSTKLQVYSSGMAIFEISIIDRICMNGVCKDELKFNQEFFGRLHYRGFLNDILKSNPIYSSRNLVTTDCGFEQNLSYLTYKICNNETFYKDSKNKIKMLIRNIH
ncbi:putative lipoprotein [Campylobacter blaseri]|uniref:Lipoprotein n=1 Tax=Campylobacter blaseri TaxID=2042961 RepID=A0A2P8R0V1_9BACT|nr:hypothetical protein [Campylobacter blaseri]PSM52125.1 hypothetical protein CQ405_03450 [Campylobacter blaseri]PSM53891.1 hypothetical protein CRN67_03450 [Campylobacter blaseri]QKF85325.1 putative lipoprotein [Campylobacter blaseri]